MGTTSNIFTDLSREKGVYLEYDKNGIRLQPYSAPRIITPDLRGFYLALYDLNWTTKTCQGEGAATYFVRVVPIYRGMTDAAGDWLKGAANTENTTKAVSFWFDPMPAEYPCDGYEVWAGTVSGTLYKQGYLYGRYSNYFKIGVTWSYSTAGGALTALTMGPPLFASCGVNAAAQDATDNRLLLGGGKDYQAGYARVSKTTAAPVLTGGVNALSTLASWQAVTDGSFRARIDDYLYDITGLNFSAAADMDGVAAVIQAGVRAEQLAKVTGGIYPETILAKWQAITDGSFRIRCHDTWYDVTGCDFSGVATMAEVATELTAQLQAAGAWGAISWDATAGRFNVTLTQSEGSEDLTNGSFTGGGADWTQLLPGTPVVFANNRAEFSVASPGQSGIYQGVANLGSVKRVVRATAQCVTAGNYAFAIYEFNSDGSNATTYPYLATVDGVPVALEQSAYITLPDTNPHSVVVYFEASAGKDRLYFYQNASYGKFNLDDVSCKAYRGIAAISTLEKHSAGTGTDVSFMTACRENDTGIYVVPFTKAASTETCTWSTDHFIVTGDTAGALYRLSYLTAALVSKGTDVSVAAYMDCRSNSTSAVYTPGQTALRTVLGNGVEWGKWSEGMTIRFSNESVSLLIQRQVEVDSLYLDAAYIGNDVTGWYEYIMEPYGQQYYVSESGNPFYYTEEGIVPVKISDSDRIVAFAQAGYTIVGFMNHHTFIVDPNSVKFPVVISEETGAYNARCIIQYERRIFFFSGDDFMYTTGSKLDSLDPYNKIKSIISRLSTLAPAPHAVVHYGTDSDIIKWFMGIDNATVCNIAVCFEPKSGNFWIENVKDANASCTIRTSDKKTYLITGNKYDAANTGRAFTFLHGDAYKNDGASQGTANTKQGIISAVNAATTTAGYLTCAKLKGVLADFAAVTAGYFRASVDGELYNVGPCDFTGVANLAGVAAVVQVALRYQTGGLETVTFDADHFIITSATTTNNSNIGYLLPYYPSNNSVSISGYNYLNGEQDQAVITYAVNKQALNLQTMAAGACTLSTDQDGEMGIYIFVCDTSLRNGQYARVISNTADTITVTPSFATQPAAGWFWYLGGIVPRISKWLDFNSPQHKHKVHEISMTVKPGQTASGNRLAIHERQDLSSVIRKTKIIALGPAADTVNAVNPSDQYATQIGLEFMRPSSVQDLDIEDITITHRSRV